VSATGAESVSNPCRLQVRRPACTIAFQEGPTPSKELTRAVGALILQEADKIRAMVRDARTS